MSLCIDEDTLCRWHLMMMQEEIGDKAAAQQTRQELMKLNRRDRIYVYVRAKLVATEKPGVVATRK